MTMEKYLCTYIGHVKVSIFQHAIYLRDFPTLLNICVCVCVRSKFI